MTRPGRSAIGRVAALLALLTAVLAAPLPVHADTAIPEGRFFTEAVPDRTDGTGFAVVDGHGVDLWTQFQAHGGVEVLGYPISRRFLLDGSIAQAFANGILRWDPASATWQQLPSRPLPREVTDAEPPPLASGEAETRPWSGWWWPASDGIGATLYAPNSPLDKYDRYVELVTGVNPGTRLWEREQLYFPNNPWAGHCNGFAAAALLEPEPTEPREILGLTFSVADLKGLLVDYHFGDATAWSYPEAGELSPAEFHRMLLNWIQGGRKGFVITFDLGNGEVWSYPAWRFESEWGPDPVSPEVWHVRTTVWMADMQVPANFVGHQPYPSEAGKVFEYTLEGDPRRPSGGAWTGASQSGRFAHPSHIWYPEPRVRNNQRVVVSPALDRETVGNIIAGSDGSDRQALAFPRF